MRVVLDTNVLISGIFWSGPPANILKLWRDGNLILIISPEIFDEYQRVANELSKRYENIPIEPILNLILSSAEVFSAKKLPNKICKDPDDDKFIACALSGKTNFIVTGDKALLRVAPIAGLRIVTPNSFLKEIKH